MRYGVLLQRVRRTFGLELYKLVTLRDEQKQQIMRQLNIPENQEKA